MISTEQRNGNGVRVVHLQPVDGVDRQWLSYLRLSIAQSYRLPVCNIRQRGNHLLSGPIVFEGVVHLRSHRTTMKQLIRRAVVAPP
ncbi:unnamed protein product [Soboliphyme baturini]|uniref:Transposase n=1 Tax=Soboliphyme baturini TaxID=241478 RepID=A0A183J018_9BILA|nr:unnamed protein product [Soboliphyme baturini]